GELAIAAIGIRPSGDALLSQVSGVPSEFRITFGPGPFEPQIGGDPVDLPVLLAPGASPGDFEVEQCRFLNADGEPRTFPPAGLSIEVVAGEGCRIVVGEGAEPGEIQVRADAVRGDERDFTITTVSIQPFGFQVTLSPSLVQLPVPTDEPEVVDFELTSNDGLNAFLCRLPTDPSGISIVEVEEAGRTLCRVTIDVGLEPADIPVQGIGQRVATLQEAQGEATLRLLPSDLGFEAELVRDDSDPETLLFFDGPLPPGNFADLGEFRLGQQNDRFDVDFEVQVRFASGPNAGEPAPGVPVDFSSLGIRVTLEAHRVLTDGNGRARIGITGQDQGGQAFVSAAAPGFQRGVTYLVPVTITANLASFDLSSVAADPTAGLLANADDASTVVVTMRLPDGTPIIDQVRFEALSDDPGAIISAPLFDGVSATASFQVRSSEPGPITVRVRIIGYPEGFGFLTDQAVITFDPLGGI
ncbi:MAG: hypothetical protein EA422_00390, partial [Gemmatimonadales bacterium]